MKSLAEYDLSDYQLFEVLVRDDQSKSASVRLAASTTDGAHLVDLTNSIAYPVDRLNLSQFPVIRAGLVKESTWIAKGKHKKIQIGSIFERTHKGQKTKGPYLRVQINALLPGRAATVWHFDLVDGALIAEAGGAQHFQPVTNLSIQVESL